MRTTLVIPVLCLVSGACSVSATTTSGVGDDASASGSGSGSGGSSGASDGSGGASSGSSGDDAGDAGSSEGPSSGGDAGIAPIPRPYCKGLSADLSTDVTHCGTCDTTCQFTGLAYGLNTPGSVVEDATNVYWAEHIASGRILRAPLGAANINNPTVIATGQKNPHALVLDGANVYWLTDDGVMKRPIAGGSAVSIAGESGGRWPGGITRDGTSIYWTTHSDASPNYAAVKKMPLGGGTAVELATLGDAVDFDAIAVDKTSVYWVYTHYQSLSSRLRDEYIYKAPLAGGTPVMVYEATGYANVYDMVTDAMYLYFSTYEVGPSIPPATNTKATLMRMPLAGGTPEFLDSDIGSPVGVALNAQGVFWATTANAQTSGVGGSVRFVPTGVGTPFEIAWNSDPTSLSVTATHLYLSSWGNNNLSNGTVTRLGLCMNNVCQ